MTVTWILEGEAFADGHRRLAEAAEAAGQRVVPWDDAWWELPSLPAVEGPAVFHGSLGNADRLAGESSWTPGAWCRTPAFFCSAYYPNTARWLVHGDCCLLPAERLARDPEGALAQLGHPEQVFVRPDSPLKPFSGRVLPADGITLEALDHGFYYDDATLPVVVAPALELGMEWRFVVVDGQLVTGSAYDPATRSSAGTVHDGRAWEVAQTIVADLPPPEPVFVLDLCELGDELRLLELNPFSGADLYDCDRARIVATVGAFVARADT